MGYYLLVEEFEFNPNHLIRTTQYYSDGSKKITEYNPQTKTKIKEVVCLTDNFIDSITDFDNSGKKTKEIFYDKCRAKNIREYNPHSGDLINSSFYPKETNKTEYHF
ncbi:MAG: DUF2963 domain-containing protein ['Conium maculatum' witches'-broom phytoplasma]|nr:DUF2963 domain-containing protein ['Conium maculatum' witches'-broom phytoplasma]